MYKHQAKGKVLSGAAGGGAAAVSRTPPADPKRKPTPSTKKAPIQSNKGLHWTEKEADLLLDIIEEVQPSGKLPVLVD